MSNNKLLEALEALETSLVTIGTENQNAQPIDPKLIEMLIDLVKVAEPDTITALDIVAKMKENDALILKMIQSKIEQPEGDHGTLANPENVVGNIVIEALAVATQGLTLRVIQEICRLAGLTTIATQPPYYDNMLVGVLKGLVAERKLVTSQRADDHMKTWTLAEAATT